MWRDRGNRSTRRNRQLLANHWQVLSPKVVSNTPRHVYIKEHTYTLLIDKMMFNFQSKTKIHVVKNSGTMMDLLAHSSSETKNSLLYHSITYLLCNNIKRFKELEGLCYIIGNLCSFPLKCVDWESLSQRTGRDIKIIRSVHIRHASTTAHEYTCF